MGFLNNIDEEKITKLMNDTEENVKYFEDISKRVANQYTESLNDIMKKIYSEIISHDEVDIDTLSKYFIELTNVLYFLGEKMETLGIYNDMSKAAAKEVYNRAYLENSIKGIDGKAKITVAENQSVAEEASKYELAVNSIYDRSYRIVKYKIDAGQEMVKTLSKLVSKKMQDQDFDSKTNKKILNENINPNYSTYKESIYG